MKKINEKIIFFQLSIIFIIPSFIYYIVNRNLKYFDILNGAENHFFLFESNLLVQALVFLNICLLYIIF